MTKFSRPTLRWARPRRRGVALLIVLAVLVITVPMVAAIAHHASLVRLESEIRSASHIADDLREAIESGFLPAWLESESADVVLPPDVEVASVELVNESWSTIDHRCRVRITAFDQCGMVPIAMTNAGNPLRLALPTDVLRQLDHAPRAQSSQNRPGLDLFDGAIPVGDPSLNSSMLGSWVATHQTPMDQKRGTRETGAIININTAPVPLLKAAMRAAGRGGIEAIIGARARHEPASTGMSVMTRTSTHGESPASQITFTNASGAWAFRIDIEVEQVNQSWWCVYERTSNGWECTQRLAILD